MKRKYHNYGYKVCYCEADRKNYVLHFKTYTYNQAFDARIGYIFFPPTAHEDRRILNSPRWKIIPISKKEIKAGIWREVPF